MYPLVFMLFNAAWMRVYFLFPMTVSQLWITSFTPLTFPCLFPFCFSPHLPCFKPCLNYLEEAVVISHHKIELNCLPQPLSWCEKHIVTVSKQTFTRVYTSAIKQNRRVHFGTGLCSCRNVGRDHLDLDTASVLLSLSSLPPPLQPEN